MTEAVMEPETAEASAFDFETYAREMAAKEPDGVLSPPEGMNEASKVPGFDKMTFATANVYEITWDMLGVLWEAKAKFFEATIVGTSTGTYITRGFSRREWETMQKEMISEAEKRYKNHMEIKSIQRWADEDVKMKGEEHVALAGLVYPPMDIQELRSLPSGVINQIFEAVLAASGFDQQNNLPPLKL